jgi:hypothetical protein
VCIGANRILNFFHRANNSDFIDHLVTHCSGSLVSVLFRSTLSNGCRCIFVPRPGKMLVLYRCCVVWPEGHSEDVAPQRFVISDQHHRTVNDLDILPILPGAPASAHQPPAMPLASAQRINSMVCSTLGPAGRVTAIRLSNGMGRALYAWRCRAPVLCRSFPRKEWARSDAHVVASSFLWQLGRLSQAELLREGFARG